MVRGRPHDPVQESRPRLLEDERCVGGEVAVGVASSIKLPIWLGFGPARFRNPQIRAAVGNQLLDNGGPTGVGLSGFSAHASSVDFQLTGAIRASSHIGG